MITITKDILKTVVNAINNVFDSRIKELNYLYHVKGKIYSVVNLNEKEYEIEYNGQVITAFNYRDLDLNVGDIVDVLYSNIDKTYRVINFKY